MKIGKYDVTLSRPTSGRYLFAKKPAPNVKGEEQGSAGAYSPGYFAMEAYLGGIKTPTVRQIMNMIDEDGTAAGIYNVVTFPVLATDWHMEPDPEDVVTDSEGNETHPQADFVTKCLRDPQHKGGMSTPFSLVLADILLAVAQGHRFFEIVYKLDENGFIVFQKVVARDNGTYTILTDDTGGFAGVEQQVTSKAGKTQKVTIELPYCFLYTYRKERDKLKGLSAFRAGFYHYDKKHRLYYLANQQAQQAAINPKILELPDADVPKEQRDENLRQVDAMAVRPSIALPFGYKLDIKSPGKGVELMPYIDHHNVEYARAVLAQMTMLGLQSDSKGGSYSLSANQTDLFMLGERTLITTIEEHITAFLISKLIDYNFEKPLYPTFKFNDLSDSVTMLLTEAFKALVSKGTVPQWVTDGISKRVAEQMEIEEPEDTDVDDGSDDDESTTVEQSRKKKDLKLAKTKWWRELTATEAKVQFSAIKKKADTQEELLLKDLKPVFNKVSSDATTRLKPLLESKGAKALDGFELKYGNEIQKVFNNHMLEMYSDAKTKAADEIKKNAPANKQSSKDLISQHTTAVVEKQYGDLLFNLKAIVTDAVRKNLLDKTELSVGKVIASIASMFSDFYENKESVTASVLITTALNIGRDDVFQAFRSKIYGYQYSAILDDVVCEVCEDLDGSVVEEAEYHSTVWMPPIHFNCRCIWVAIMSDEEDPPDYSSLPDEPGGSDAPSLSKSSEYGTFLAKLSDELWDSKPRTDL